MIRVRDIKEAIDIIRTFKVVLINPNLLDKHYKDKLMIRMDRVLSQYEKDNERNKNG
jgi:hypothetical protein|tara:strand:- start:206 stop:376 length:171 start_codon:yes stop_codon:yes gene_type:complete